MEDNTKRYDNGEITVIWQPGLCAHSANCVRGLPAVFNLAQKPWINVHGADTWTIISQVNKCPSGALSFVRNQEK
jgi:uncharacterized Fe-S cluster protein YjdI